MNRKLKTIIIDDESLARQIIKQYLSNFPEIELIDECSNGFDAVKSVSNYKPDFIFLDVQMPKLTGFEMLELIENPPFIIFTTAYDNFAIKAFEINAVDYLLKPFSPERLKAAIEKLKLNIASQNASVQVEKISNYIIEKVDYLERIAVKDGSNIFVINIEEINWIEAQDDYVLIYTNEKKYLKNNTMKYYENHLNPNDFVRIHRSFLVNLKKIKKLELFGKDSYKVILIDNKSLSVSKSGYEKLKQKLNG